MKTEIEPGDIVMLKSGGPAMVVEHLKDGEAGRVYFPGDTDEYGPEPIRDNFSSITLVVLSE